MKLVSTPLEVILGFKSHSMRIFPPNIKLKC